MDGGRLRIICGPTAAGKSALALELAASCNAAILSADSRQIYRGFDVGTAKPDSDDRARAPHYGIDIAEPTERFSAARWAAEATRWMQNARAHGREPVIVGGTGLYIKALVEPLAPAPDLDPVRRGALASELGGMLLSDLRRWCKELDPPRAHLGRTQLLRAIETALLSGERISTVHSAHNSTATRAARSQTARYLVVDPGAPLVSRIEQRVDRMLEQGWEAEVVRLAQQLPRAAPAWKASGYRVMLDLVNGQLDLSSARERVIIETRQYAKRQRTWFRHQLSPATVTRVNPDDPGAGAVVREWWERAD